MDEHVQRFAFPFVDILKDNNLNGNKTSVSKLERIEK